MRDAIDQAKHAALAMLGKPTPYREVPWFWSDQYDLSIQIAGLPSFASDVAVRETPDSLLLFRGQLQVLGKVGKFLVDRLSCMDMLKLLTRRGLLSAIMLSYGTARNCETQHQSIHERERSISHGRAMLLKIPDIIPVETL